MKKISAVVLCLAVSFLYYSCNTTPAGEAHTITILQLNDVYEIGAISGGREGGMARVATVRNELMANDPNTITVLSGDFVSPSLIGTLKYPDSTTGDSVIAGRQMVDVMNALGMDYVTFGNHEFDIPMSRLRARINESNFGWVSCNVSRKTNEGKAPFLKLKAGKTDTIQPFIIRSIFFKNNDSIRLGFIGATLNSNLADSVLYDDVITSVGNTYNMIKDRCDVVVAITHLSLDADKKLAAAVPGLNLIIGGHEHTNSISKIGNLNICKADANAKSVYIHKISIDKSKPTSEKVAITSTLKKIDSTIKFDEAVDKVVKKWQEIGNSSLEKSGYQPNRQLMTAAQPLEGRDEFTRTSSTNFTRLIAQAIAYYYPDAKADMVMYNSGSIRLDDQLVGEVTEYDVLRSLPFGGGNVTMDLKGDTLKQVLDIGLNTNKNGGGFLQYYGLKVNNGVYEINGKPLSNTAKYHILMPEFVAKGKEQNLSLLKGRKYDQPTMKAGQKNDIRDAVIAYMLSGMGKPKWEN